jgi:hypothetical protein
VTTLNLKVLSLSRMGWYPQTRTHFFCLALMNSSANGIAAYILSLSSGYRFSHSCSASSDLKRFVTPQPPPANTIVEAGSTVASFPLSNTT